MKKILIVYNSMCIGGSTTSLLSLLSSLDYSKYEVDLLLATKTGELYEMIPKSVRVLPEAWPQDIRAQKAKSIRSIILKGYGTALAKKRRKEIIKDQVMAYENARLSRRIEERYDIAIAFLENFPLNYIANYVNAKKKIGWIHVDYLGTGFVPAIDRKSFRKVDNFVLVSPECLESFDKAFPELEKQSTMIPNLISAEILRERASENIDFLVDDRFLNIITVSRVTFAHKGLDRGIKAIAKLSKEGRADKLRWYILGEGKDESKLRFMISTYHLENKVILLGKKTNPFPYMVQMDAFLLPSRYEGKPIAVTEAQILGVPPIVTNYASAHGQIKNEVNGYIVPNEDDTIYDAIKFIIDHPNDLHKWRENLKKESFENLDEIQKIYEMIED